MVAPNAELYMPATASIVPREHHGPFLFVGQGAEQLTNERLGWLGRTRLGLRLSGLLGLESGRDRAQRSYGDHPRYAGADKPTAVQALAVIAIRAIRFLRLEHSNSPWGPLALPLREGID